MNEKEKEKNNKKDFLIELTKIGIYTVCGFVLGYLGKKYFSSPSKSEIIEDGYVGLIGETKMIKLNSLSKATGCTILAKCEFLNPGGSSKDRIAKKMIQDAESQGKIKKGGTVYEGTGKIKKKIN